MSDETPINESQAINAAELDRLQAELMATVQAMRLNAFLRGKNILCRAELAEVLNLEQVAEEIHRAAAVPRAGSSPLPDAYFLALLARHVPFDDWSDDLPGLASQAVAAVREELAAISWEHDVPPRMRLLLDSCLRVIGRLSGVPEPEI
jgi:hypothetical protein